MKFNLLLVALFAALTSAIKINDLVAKIPGCAHQCFVDIIPTSGCGFLDNGCQCRPNNRNFLTEHLTPCLSKACSDPYALISVLGITNEICSIEAANSFTVAGTQSVSVPAAVYSSFSIMSPTAAAMPTAKPALAGAALAGLAALAI